MKSEFEGEKERVAVVSAGRNLERERSGGSVG